MNKRVLPKAVNERYRDDGEHASRLVQNIDSPFVRGILDRPEVILLTPAVQRQDFIGFKAPLFILRPRCRASEKGDIGSLGMRTRSAFDDFDRKLSTKEFD